MPTIWLHWLSLTLSLSPPPTLMHQQNSSKSSEPSPSASNSVMIAAISPALACIPASAKSGAHSCAPTVPEPSASYLAWRGHMPWH